MKMQQTHADPIALTSEEDDSAETKAKLEMLRRLSEPEQMENYLSYGKWDLNDADILRLQKDDEMKQRVSIRIIYLANTQLFFRQRSDNLIDYYMCTSPNLRTECTWNIVHFFRSEYLYILQTRNLSGGYILIHVNGQKKDIGSNSNSFNLQSNKLIQIPRRRGVYDIFHTINNNLSLASNKNIS